MVFSNAYKLGPHSYSRVESATTVELTEIATDTVRTKDSTATTSSLLHRRLEPGWNTTLRAGGTVVATVLTLNISLLILSYVKPSSTSITSGSPGFSPIFLGSCQRAKAITTASHLLINILGSLLLATSAAAIQILSAPTRAQVDEAHVKGKWLDIGLLSLRNIRVIPRKQAILCIIMTLSSVPLHLLYNSVIFQSIGINDTITIVGSETIATTKPAWSESFQPLITEGLVSSFSDTSGDVYECYQLGYCAPEVASNSTMVLSRLRTSIAAGNLTHMDRSECITTFAPGLAQGYSAVVIVSNLTSYFNDSAVVGQMRTNVAQPPAWTQNNPGETLHGDIGFHPFYKYPNGTRGVYNIDMWYYGANNVSIPINRQFDFEYCLVQLEPQSCSVQVSQGLLITVIIANLIKLVSICYMVLFLKHRPLVTIGDAVVSFLQHPDPVTVDFGPISWSDVRKKGKKKKRWWWWWRRKEEDNTIVTSRDESSWQSSRRRWFEAASRTRWLVAMGLCSFIVAAAIIISFSSMSSPYHSLTEAWKTGFGTVSTDSQVEVKVSTVTAVLLANVPQLLITNVYVLYNGLITSMLLASEFTDFAGKAKSMRVSPSRHGEQRTSYYLQVPLRIGLPLMALLAVLHWLVSQSFFLIHIDAFSMDQTLVKAGMMVAVGYSLQAIVVSVALGILITSIPVALGFRRFPAGIPIVGHCSLAISAACHRKQDEPPDAAGKKLRYGVLPEAGPSGHRRTGFSSEAVELLVDGEVYEQSRQEYMLLPLPRSIDEARGDDGNVGRRGIMNVSTGASSIQAQPLVSTVDMVYPDKRDEK